MPKPVKPETRAQQTPAVPVQAASQPPADDDTLLGRWGGVQSLLQTAKKTAAPDLGCSCARCLRKAGPVREDAEERILHITHVLADVYEETPNPEEHIKPHHRTRARQFLQAVEANDVQKLETYFLECQEEHRGEIVGELIISASQAGHVDTIRCLAKYATDDDYLDMSDSTKGARPLMFAAHNGHVAAVRLLLELGADPNATDDHGYNALTISTFCDRAGCCEALCQHKETIIDQVDERERTALSYAALYGSDNCVHVLVAHGANVFHQDDEQADPLDLAEQSGRASTADALRKLQLKARMAMRRAERKADAAEKAAHQALDEEERERRAAEAEAKMRELLEECLREESAKKAQADKQKKAKKRTDSNPRKQPPVKSGTGATVSSHPLPRTGSASSSESGALAASHSPAAEQAETPQGKSGKASRKGSHAAAPHEPTIANGHHPPKRRDASSEPAAATAATPQPQSQQQQQLHDGPPGLALPPADAPEPVLRKAWETLLEEAKDCRDAALQHRYLDAVRALLPRAADAGISVKYGRKVLQRLETVGPAREALSQALGRRGGSTGEELEAALKLARPAASLLDPALLAEAEAVLEACRASEEETRLELAAQKQEALQRQEEEYLLQQRQQAAAAAAAAAAPPQPHPPAAAPRSQPPQHPPAAAQKAAAHPAHPPPPPPQHAQQHGHPHPHMQNHFRPAQHPQQPQHPGHMQHAGHPPQPRPAQPYMPPGAHVRPAQPGQPVLPAMVAPPAHMQPVPGHMMGPQHMQHGGPPRGPVPGMPGPPGQHSHHMLQQHDPRMGPPQQMHPPQGPPPGAHMQHASPQPPQGPAPAHPAPGAQTSQPPRSQHVSAGSRHTSGEHQYLLQQHHQAPQQPPAGHTFASPSPREFVPTIGAFSQRPVVGNQPLAPLSVSPPSATSQGQGLLHANNNLPSPTAPLSVAAAALGLGGLSLQPFGSDPGSAAEAPGSQQGGQQQSLASGALLAALKASPGPPASSISSLGSSTPGAGGGGGFNVAGLSVPPTLAALWDKPVRSSPPTPQPAQPQAAQPQQPQQQAPAQSAQPQQPPAQQQPTLPAHLLQQPQQQQQGPMPVPMRQPMGKPAYQQPMMVPAVQAQQLRPPMQAGPRGPMGLSHGAQMGPGYQGNGGLGPAANTVHHLHGLPPFGMQHQHPMQHQHAGMLGQQHGGRTSPGMPGKPGPPMPGRAMLCVACQSNVMDAVCWPCLDVCLCKSCAHRRQSSRGPCPACGRVIEQVYDHQHHHH